LNENNPAYLVNFGRAPTALPLSASSLGEAAAKIGATPFKGTPSRRIVIGTNEIPDAGWSVATWWNAWRAGTSEIGEYPCPRSDNPLVGIAAGALAVGKAFEAERGRCPDLRSEIDLWPMPREDLEAPSFAEVFLPGSIWLIGLGNLGQAFLWALTALPYADPGSVSLVLQDRDKISAENWATSVLVRDGIYGVFKTLAGEHWAQAKGFEVRRIDRRLVAADRLQDDDPRVALSGLDKIEARRYLDLVGFDCIIDAGLGRTAKEFDRYRVTVFDRNRSIDKHFADQKDPPIGDAIPAEKAYQQLEAEIGRCGTSEIAGASVAAPYVSAVAAAIATSRLIAVTSGCTCPSSEVGRLSSLGTRRIAPAVKVEARGSRHSGRPYISNK